ncbi:MOSC domain-containing protein [Flavobacterium sp. ZT3R18]|uniref:MOSC domain-containing protein n=1 Tax=Flavobacterium sp. ZT3R18 TaxID=2594429 RepID=UPI00117ADB93|nr:MOSC N-terminal beta barrel domain-containing protein [Flavobacterium sp. ZT3R18]TRX38683.1 MOSC domain-containing protein [Flavobacterium sp. ZT3R18]
MLQLSEIWVYPVKSLGGIQLQESKVTDRGLELDRRWLLVDDNGRFLSQREHPELALFKPEIAGDFLRITHRTHLESIDIPLRPVFSDTMAKIKVTVWDDTIDAFEVSQGATDWFTKQLGVSVRLVYMPQESERKLSRSLGTDYAITGAEINSFSDGYPFLIIGQSSLEDLNGRLEVKIPMNRFRPNFVFTNGDPFEEDTWREFSIGNVSFVGVKPCDRCVMTTVDQEKGVVSGKDPLKTLAKYRNFGNKVLFGQNVIGLGLGSVSVGDAVSVLSFDK